MSDLLVSASAPATARPVRRRGPLAVLPDLARVHAVRMMRHPVFLLGVAWLVAGVGFGLPDTPYERYSSVTGQVAFLIGPLAFFAANLVASSGRRSGADEWMPSLPMPARRRTTALLLACLGPAVVAAALDLVLLVSVDVSGPTLPLRWQHVASVPVTVLGGALLGAAVARLLPWPGVPIAVMVGLVSFNAWASGHHPQLGFYVDYAVWTNSDAVPALHAGSPTWHLLYLVALCCLAATGALLRDARRRWLPLAVGAVLALVVLVAGTAQLP